MNALTDLHTNPQILSYIESRYFTGFKITALETHLQLVSDDSTVLSLLTHAKIIKEAAGDESITLNMQLLLNRRMALKKAQRDLRLEYEVESCDLIEAIALINAFSDPLIKARIDEGYVMYSDLPVLLARGASVVCENAVGLLGGQVETCSEQTSFFGSNYMVVLSIVVPTAQGSTIGKHTYRMAAFEGKIAIDKLAIRPLDGATRESLTARGLLFREFTQCPTPANYSGSLTIPSWMRDYKMHADGRVMIDGGSFAQIDPDTYHEMMNIFRLDEGLAGLVQDGDLWRCYPQVQAFSMRLKRWGWIAVDGLSPIVWREDAFDHLVLASEHKKVLLDLVTHYDATSSDFIDDKSRGLIVLLHGKSGTGKAQPLDCMIQTPTGPRRMGDIQVGDHVLTPDGGSAKVLAIYPQGKRPCFRLTFSDGRSTMADAEHLWRVKIEDETWDTITTHKLKNQIQWCKCRIPVTEPFIKQAIELPLDPWLLGILLGDGGFTSRSMSLTMADQYILDRVASLLPSGYLLKHQDGYSYRITTDDHDLDSAMQHEVRAKWVDLGLADLGAAEKFVPELYFQASPEQRLALLRGLIDRDGIVGKTGDINYYTSSKRLAADMQRLIWSLGGIAPIAPTKNSSYDRRKLHSVEAEESYTVAVRVKHPAHFVSLPRKQVRAADVIHYADNFGLRVAAIEQIDDQETQCILIDHPAHLYLTDDFLVTHNTLTVEAVAEVLHRMIYSVSIGELGTNPNDLESRLRSILDLAQHWNAVLKLDEADIFMEARDADNIERNAMVSIFLRQLEYFSGVMFLTTNRVRSFDPAFFSRISLPISYPDMTKQLRTQVWHSVLEGARLDADRFDIPALSDHEVNGRNITSAVRQAQTLALAEQRTVQQADIERSLDMMAEFAAMIDG